MGKEGKDNEAQKLIKALEKDIKTTTSLTANLTRFVKKLEKHHQNISSKQYLIRVHNCIHHYKVLGEKYCNSYQESLQFGRVCKSCGDWKNRQSMIECQNCEDYYHIYCQGDDDYDKKIWYCTACAKIKSIESNVDENIIKLHQSYTTEQYNNRCGQCKDLLVENITSCLKCGVQFHLQCLALNSSSPLCQNCHLQTEQRINNIKQLIQKTLQDYSNAENTAQWMMNMQFQEDIYKQFTVINSSQLRLKPPDKLSQKEIEFYRNQLLYAIYSKGMEYSEERPPHEVEKGFFYGDISAQVMHKRDQVAYLIYKNQPIGPFRLVYLQNKGYDVQAGKYIPIGTIICQYIGEVVTKRQARQLPKNDSLFDLVIGPNADSSLMIRPQKYTNIGRFLNGVNDNSPIQMKKINVKSVRLIVSGKPIVLLYAIRNINEGESLVYNYNGALKLYPTEGFH